MVNSFPDLNQQYTEVQNTSLVYSANVEPMRDLKIDLTGNRTFAENYLKALSRQLKMV